MLVGLFSEDGVFRVNYDGELVNTKEGTEALFAEFSGRVERRIQNDIGYGHHYMTNIMLNMPRVDYIEAKVMVLSTIRPPGEVVRLESQGMYEWEFKKEDGDWKIAKLEIFYN